MNVARSNRRSPKIWTNVESLDRASDPAQERERPTCPAFGRSHGAPAKRSDEGMSPLARLLQGTTLEDANPAQRAVSVMPSKAVSG